MPDYFIKSGSNQIVGASTSVSITLTDIPAGAVVFAVVGTSVTYSSFSDNQGNTWTQLYASSSGRMRVFICENANAAASTQFSFSASGNGLREIAVAVYKNINTSVLANFLSNSGGTATLSLGNFDVVRNDILFSFAGKSGTAQSGGCSPNNVGTTRENFSNTLIADEHYMTTASGISRTINIRTGSGRIYDIFTIKLSLYVSPTVTTQAVSDITKDSVTGNGNITSTGGANATRRGFCYLQGSSGDPTTANSVVYDDGSFGTGAYTKAITGLTPNTAYRVRAYAVNSAGTSYGSTVGFTTLKADESNFFQLF